MIEFSNRSRKLSIVAPVSRSLIFVAVMCCCGVVAGAHEQQSASRVFRAGAAAVDITPTKFPVIVNGQFAEGTGKRAHDRLMSRAVVLDDGKIRLTLVVVDSLMIPRDLLDDAKQLAQESTGIPAERMLISATHTHSAPSAMGCLGSRADADYQPFLVDRIAKSIEEAAAKLEPARVGWAVVKDHRHNHCRRWIYRPDRIAVDPFGVRNVRAHMHPGYQSKNHIAPSGPADTDLSLLSVQSKNGRPLAVLANYALHYYGSPLISGDFCGRFGSQLSELIGVKANERPFVGMMSQGTSGDSMWMDYGAPAGKRDLDQYTLEVARVAYEAYKSIEYRDSVSLAMAETKLKLRRRVPDEERLMWARSAVAEIGNRLPRSRPEIYARELIYLHDKPEVEIKLQAVRIGELGITAIPNEVYGLTGLKLKTQSPLRPTFNIELANGAQGYIPPPEQHFLGGYTTWPARTAGLEVRAEPVIVETLLGLLEQVAGKPRRPVVPPENDYATGVLASKPAAYWRLCEMAGTRATDAIGRHHGHFERGMAWFLPGFAQSPEQQKTTSNRAAHFAGGRMHAVVAHPGETWSAELWFWNGLPNDVRPVTGYIFSRGAPDSKNADGDHLGIGGTSMNAANAGKLIFFNGDRKNELLVGRTTLEPKTWNHVVLIRDGQHVSVYLNGNNTPEINGDVTVSRPNNVDDIFVGGRNDGFAPFEGKLSDVAVYDRVLSQHEVASHFQASGFKTPGPSDGVPSNGAITPESAPLSPSESLAVTHIRDGFDIELVAAEPFVKDPVAIAWGTDGRLWVAEMADYPLGLDGKGKPGGRVRFLQDTDGDGQYDRSTLFLDGIRFPTGVMPWRDGVLITAAPEILYAEDTNGDGTADKREVLYSGFQEGNQQLRVNGLRWGLDNWVYCASGAHHGGYGADRRLHVANSDTMVELGSRDFRFRPDTGAIDPQSGPSQFGRNRDDWGNWFGQQNSFPLWHFVLQDHYLRRNPHFAPPDPRKQMFPARNPKVYPAKSPQKRFHGFEQSGRFTSACSAMIYRDELLFPRQPASQHAFTCEPFHNLVQHNVIVDDGASFRLLRDAAEAQTDFFASRDRWCRPVMARTGPDGALWIVDMYRYMIEHPQWLPPEGKKELEPFYRSGDDRGRIYRVFPKGDRPRRIQNLNALETPDLVAALDSPNGAQRDLASQFIQWQNDEAATAPLEQMAQECLNPLGRLHALCTLEGLGRLSPTIVQRALRDQHAGIRRQAIRLTETLADRDPSLIAAASKLIDDPDARIRLQLACTLGQWSGTDCAIALTKLAISDADDSYIATAMISSINRDNLNDVLTAALAQRNNAVAGRLVGRLLALSVAFDNHAATLDGLEAILNIDQREHRIWQWETVAGLLDALQQRDVTLESLVRKDGEQRRRLLLLQATTLINDARMTAVDAKADETLRTAAIRLLARHPATLSADIDELGSLLTPQSSPAIQIAVVRHLGSLTAPIVSWVLLNNWSSHGPALRTEILSVLSTRPEWLTELLNAIENGRVARADIGAATRQSLSNFRDKAIRSRVVKLLADAGSEDRRQVILDHQEVLSLIGSPERGRATFKKQCSICHKLDGIGHDIGSNLRSLTDRKPASLLTSILDPSAAVDGKFVTYLAVTDDGRTFTGMIASETANSITLIEQENKQRVILRNQLEEIRSTGKSLMPEGFEKQMKPQDFADVIAYIRLKDKE